MLSLEVGHVGFGHKRCTGVDQRRDSLTPDRLDQRVDTVFRHLGRELRDTGVFYPVGQSFSLTAAEIETDQLDGSGAMPFYRRHQMRGGAIHQCLHRVYKAEKLQHGWPRVVNDHPQLAQAVVDFFLQRRKIAVQGTAPVGQPPDVARNTREVGHCLVMQVHADGAAGILKRFGQLPRTKTESFGAGFRLSLLDGALAGKLTLPLAATPDLGGVYGVNDSMALGAVDVAKEKGLLGKMVILGNDGEKDASGELTGTQYTDVFQPGCFAAAAATVLATGLVSADAFGQPGRVLMPYLIATAENVGEIQPNQRWQSVAEGDGPGANIRAGRSLRE